MRRADLSKKMIGTDLTIGHTRAQVREFVERAVSHELYGVCVFQNMVETAVEAAKGRLKVCTVSGYPSGIDVPVTKQADASLSCRRGADEIDLGVNLSAFKSGDRETLMKELNNTADLVHQEGGHIFAVLNTYQLEKREIEELVMLCEGCGVDGLKTTSADSVIPRQTVPEDVKVIREFLKKNLWIKAEGLVNTREDAWGLLASGADIVCSSNVFEILDLADEPKRGEGGRRE